MAANTFFIDFLYEVDDLESAEVSRRPMGFHGNSWWLNGG
jgi:hypothetical protein